MNIFLTGSNGYIGNAFLFKAANKGHTIFAVTQKRKNKKIRNVNWLVGPINKKWKELKKSDVLVHVAAAGVNEVIADYKKYYDFNVIKSKKLIENAIVAGCKKWLIISSNKEKKIKILKHNYKTIKKYEKKPFYIYGLTKLLFSQICVKLSIKNKAKCRIIRLYHVYGGNEKKTRMWPSLINAAKKNKRSNITNSLYM